MLKEGDKIVIAGSCGQVFRCGENPKIYYVGWTDRRILDVFNVVNLSTFTKENIKPLMPDLTYALATAWDSPDFYDLENLTMWVSMLETLALSKEIKILK